MLSQGIAWAPGVGIKRMELTVHTSNDRAVSLYRKFGFEVEGTGWRATNPFWWDFTR